MGKEMGSFIDSDADLNNSNDLEAVKNFKNEGKRVVAYVEIDGKNRRIS